MVTGSAEIQAHSGSVVDAFDAFLADRAISDSTPRNVRRGDVSKSLYDALQTDERVWLAGRAGSGKSTSIVTSARDTLRGNPQVSTFFAPLYLFSGLDKPSDMLDWLGAHSYGKLPRDGFVSD
jgi:hypothetical protein